MTGKIFIDQLANGTSFIDEQQGDAMSEIRRWEHFPGGMMTSRRPGKYVLWEDHRAEVERLTKKRDDAAKAERARCIRAIQRMSVPVDQFDGAMRAIAAIEALETEDTP